MPYETPIPVSSVRSLARDSDAPIIIDARRGTMPLLDMLASPGETRAKAIDDGRLWIANAAVTPESSEFGDREQTFCTIQPYTSEELSIKMRQAFVSQRRSDSRIYPSFEVIGTRSEVRHAIAPMFNTDEVILCWLPADL